MTSQRSAIQLTGLLLWRGGMAFAAAAALYYGAWAWLSGLLWPAHIRVGLALALAGAGLVAVSLVLERHHDAVIEESLNP